MSTGIVCLTIPCVKHEYIFAIGFSRQSWILWRCRPHKSAATHISMAISRSTVTLFQVTISSQCWRSFHCRFHRSTMTLFRLLISFVNRELVCAVDSIRQPWLSFKDDFSFYSVSVFAADFRISTGMVCLTIPCVKHEYIFAIGFSPRSWILWRCRPHTSAATHIIVAISRSPLTLFSLTISSQ
jgi:predicted membrane protein